MNLNRLPLHQIYWSQAVQVASPVDGLRFFSRVVLGEKSSFSLGSIPLARTHIGVLNSFGLFWYELAHCSLARRDGRRTKQKWYSIVI